MHANIYTMPEAFILDPNVAIKWKLYALINGFWLNSKPVFASNEWFSEKLQCSERTIRYALSELEEAGLLTRDIKGVERYILPGGVKGGSPASGGEEAQLPPREEAQLPHIAVKYNALSINLEPHAAREEDEDDMKLEPDEDTIPNRPLRKRVPPDKNSRAVMEWAEQKTGLRFPNPLKQMSTIKTMLSMGHSVESIKETWERLEKDPYWGEKGVDFGTVLINIAKAKKPPRLGFKKY